MKTKLNNPQVTLPTHEIRLFAPNNDHNTFLLQNLLQRQSSPSSSQSIHPRSPVVYFFVCDYANAKVQTVTKDFKEKLLNNGISVFIETYDKHQPGFSVRASSMNCHSDFFFQVYSKTAAKSHVRLYENGHPQKMSMNEAVATIWAKWKVRCGALSAEEVDLLSKESLINLMKEYAKIEPQNLDISSFQVQCREAIDKGICLRSLTDKAKEFEAMLNDGRQKILSQPTMPFNWKKEEGKIITKFNQIPITQGLSQPLKDVMVSVIDQTMRKIKAIKALLEQHVENSPPPKEESFYYNQLTNGSEKISDGSSWKILVQTPEEDRLVFQNIPSYGDSNKNEEYGTRCLPSNIIENF